MMNRAKANLTQALVDQACLGIGAKDLEGRYLYINRHYAQLMQRSEAEFIGRKDHELFEPEVAKCFRRADRLVQQSGKSLVVEELTPVKEALRHYLSLKFPLRDEQQRVYGTGVVSVDINPLHELTEELRRLADCDPLTGMLNRRRFLELAEREVERAKRYGLALSLVMLDVDHFKQVNDQYGHAVGDQLLKGLAQLLKEHLRGPDCLGRLGGEEFALVLPHTAQHQAVSWAEQLLTRLRTWRLPLDTGETLSMTASFGVCQLGGDAGGVDSLLVQADRLMYQAKRNGRNQVVAG